MFNTLTRRRGGRRGGFTLIELLVVMAIIAILMGLLVPTLAAVRRHIQKVRTQAAIQGLSLALGAYKQVYYAYPPDKHPSLNLSSECLVYYLSGRTIYWTSSSPSAYPWRHAIYNTIDDDSGRKSMPDFLTFNDSQLQDVDGDKAPEAMDSWQRNFIYNTGTGANPSYDQFGAPKHLVGRFDLMSAGPDQCYGQAGELHPVTHQPLTSADAVTKREDNVNNWDGDGPEGWGYNDAGYDLR